MKINGNEPVNSNIAESISVVNQFIMERNINDFIKAEASDTSIPVGDSELNICVINSGFYRICGLARRAGESSPPLLPWEKCITALLPFSPGRRGRGMRAERFRQECALDNQTERTD